MPASERYIVFGIIDVDLSMHLSIAAWTTAGTAVIMATATAAAVVAIEMAMAMAGQPKAQLWYPLLSNSPP
jgi:hypothetical protein